MHFQFQTHLIHIQMKTEIIASWTTTLYKTAMYYVITTVNNAVVWVPKDKFDTNAETITYEALIAGSEYTDKLGVVKKREKAGNNFIGCGRQIVKKYDTMAIMDHLINKGVTPSFNMG